LTTELLRCSAALQPWCDFVHELIGVHFYPPNYTAALRLKKLAYLMPSADAKGKYMSPFHGSKQPQFRNPQLLSGTAKQNRKAVIYHCHERQLMVKNHPKAGKLQRSGISADIFFYTSKLRASLTPRFPYLFQ